MDLLGLIDTAHRALSLFGGGPDSAKPWAASESEFERHFGVPYEVFIEIVQRLNPDQEKLLRATLDVNPEAAVLWILAMEEIDGWVSG
jgi:hypothetical protein